MYLLDMYCLECKPILFDFKMKYFSYKKNIIKTSTSISLWCKIILIQVKIYNCKREVTIYFFSK